jgi:hypothetical protein
VSLALLAPVTHFKAKVRCTGRKVQTFAFPTMPVEFIANRY